MSRINDIWLRKPAGLVLGLDFSGGRTTSPTGHSGTLQNGASLSGNTLVLDGVNDHLLFADAPEFSFTSGGGVDLPFSASIWMNPLASMGNFSKAAICKGTTANYEWDMLINGGAGIGPRLALYNAAASASISRYSSAKITSSGAWVHFVSTYDGSKTAAGIRLYIDAVQVDNTTLTSGSYAGMANGTGGLAIGMELPSSIPFAGSVAGVRIYNRALTQPEIAQIYNAGAARIALGGTP